MCNLSSGAALGASVAVCDKPTVDDVCSYLGIGRLDEFSNNANAVIIELSWYPTSLASCAKNTRSPFRHE
jgi:hypothetical protein